MIENFDMFCKCSLMYDELFILIPGYELVLSNMPSLFHLHTILLNTILQYRIVSDTIHDSKMVGYLLYGSRSNCLQ